MVKQKIYTSEGDPVGEFSKEEAWEKEFERLCELSGSNIMKSDMVDYTQEFKNFIANLVEKTRMDAAREYAENEGQWMYIPMKTIVGGKVGSKKKEKAKQLK